MQSSRDPLAFGGPLLRSRGGRSLGGGGGAFKGPLKPKKVGVPEQEWAERAVAKASVVATRAALTAQHTAVAAVAAGIVRDEVDVRSAIERALRSVDAAKDASIAFDEARRALYAAQQAATDAWSSAQQKLMSAELVAQRLRPEVRDACEANIAHMRTARATMDAQLSPFRGRDASGRAPLHPHAARSDAMLSNDPLPPAQQPQLPEQRLPQYAQRRAPARRPQYSALLPTNAAATHPSSRMGRVVVPRGCGPGDVVETVTPEGLTVCVTIPAEHYEGSSFIVPFRDASAPLPPFDYGAAAVGGGRGGVGGAAFGVVPYGAENGFAPY
jgi:hypothetical protein